MFFLSVVRQKSIAPKFVRSSRDRTCSIEGNKYRITYRDGHRHPAMNPTSKSYKQEPHLPLGNTGHRPTETGVVNEGSSIKLQRNVDTCTWARLCKPEWVNALRPPWIPR